MQLILLTRDVYKLINPQITKWQISISMRVERNRLETYGVTNSNNTKRKRNPEFLKSVLRVNIYNQMLSSKMDILLSACTGHFGVKTVNSNVSFYLGGYQTSKPSTLRPALEHPVALRALYASARPKPLQPY